ncbi:putative inactive cadmium/zinc-transporting ATPase HMA3 isoform X3 [Hevea brasiliensis]|uniref:putative inactive cadmium/zinc-transporting ATPase HMA3 isoform X3 n=1 Tax=Hevea brasiliensis TaxID=3981 RepID=UPI0025F22C97|nr:putative inactive cadmium/zinc-transporting ATPase HMA3 isoform X3 [Hevea brasiliensis]
MFSLDSEEKKMAGQDKSEAANSSSKKKFQKSYFDVLGLCCSSEVRLIENILNSLDGVKEFSVIVPTRTVVVLHDDLLISQLQIVKALNQARLEANVRVNGDTSYQKKWPNPFAVASGVLLLVSLLKYVYYPLHWVALGAVAVGIPLILLKAIASIRNFRFDTNILVLIAVMGTIAMHDYIEAGTIVFLFTIAEWLESRASHKANAVMSSLMSIAPQKAVIAETGEEVDVHEVKLNTVLAVKAGETIPIDGIVVDGNCEVDEKSLTGESFPVPKQKDSTVWAGTINLNGYISFKTSALAEDCVVAKMAKLVEEAQSSKSKTQRFIDKISQYYTPGVIIISVSFAVVPLALRVHNRKHWFRLALVVLVSACPCALILSTPVATFCALTRAATSGVLIKGGSYLEILAKIKVMAFDKTGTITKGEFVVTDFQSLCEGVSIDTLLYWVSSIESKSSHPMAAALVDYGRSLSVEPNPENVVDFQNFPGEGIYGKIDEKEIYIGNRKMALRAGCGTAPELESGEMKRGKTIGYVYSGATPAGIFSLSDACRTGVAEAIAELKSYGIKTAMLTGDSQAAAMHAQEQLGHALEVVHAELLPEDKARILETFKKEGPTAMIGDGLNDAPALATADIGISMGISGSALATETGHVILMSNDIRKVPKAIQLARKAHRKVIENVILSISTKSAILALAFAGHPLVWAAVLTDVGTCLLVIFNSMLLLRGTHQNGGKCCKSLAVENTKKCESEHSPHHQKPCCSNQKFPKMCKPQDLQICALRCESDDPNVKLSCGNNRCTDSADRLTNEMKHCDHGSCKAVDLEENNAHKHHACSGSQNLSSSMRHNCKSSAEMQGKCIEGDGQHKGKHSRQRHYDQVTHLCTSNHSTEIKEGTNNGHCHSNHCEDYLENTIESHFNHGPHSLNRVITNCCHSHSSLPCSTIDIHSYMSLDKREIGGCCKSYMKECCGKHGQFATGFGGGLSEIITE